MSARLVFVEIDESEAILRILNNTRDAMALPAERVRQYPKAYAVKQIRDFVFNRSKDDDGISCCERCGRSLTEFTGHMHERHPKGERVNGVYGEVSRDNSVFICANCHVIGPDSAHGNRRWHTSILNNPA